MNTHSAELHYRPGELVRRDDVRPYRWLQDLSKVRFRQLGRTGKIARIVDDPFFAVAVNDCQCV